MKNDLKLNISDLRQVESGIETARSALLEIAEASERFLTVLKEQDSNAYEELSRLWKEKVREEEEDLSYKMGVMAGMVTNYIEAMTACVSPENESMMMRVDRYDIWWNYKQIADKSSDFGGIVNDSGSSFRDYKKTFIYNILISPEENAAKKAELEAEERKEREKRERNYNKLEEFRISTLGRKQGELRGYVNDIRSIYEFSVIPFEETDDFYNKQLSREYDDWATFWDKASDVADVVVDVASGVLDGLIDFISGLWGLVKGAFELVGWGGMEILGLNIPEWLEEDVTKIFTGVEAIISDPGNVLEALGQSIADTVDEKGIAYSVGYVVADIVASIAIDKGIGKLKEVGKVEGVLNAADDVLNVTDDVINAADDVLNVADDALNVADDVLNVTDDVLNATDDVLNTVDDVLNAADDLTGLDGHGTSVIGDVVEGGLDSLCDLDELLINPNKLSGISADELYDYLISNGYDVQPLSKGSYKGIPYEEGGGFKVNWGGDRILQYHPENSSHHGGAYFKISSGKTGTIRIDLNGNIIK